MRDDREWLLDIQEAIEKIRKYSSHGRQSFIEDEMVQIWIIHHLQVIGEASNQISKPLQARYPDVPWADIIGLRNILVHQYFGIDLDRVWETVERDMPVLEHMFSEILAELEKRS